ncbi:MAG: hypothetical protein A2X77_02030 [Gammaproteobacteria bacterium GWE2_42_36]|nr:MAG: hypothetical protein A2X77_02030 [Gammaproteobacteria bacterium GWE2_42_36]HCU04943.1 23S rRNA pseudouridine(955/2504/2580) synthase [Coxiellaceae bacterium]
MIISPEKSAPKSFTITEEHADRRIDNYLVPLLKVPRALLYRFIRQGRVRVNKKRTDPSYRLQTGDQLVIYAFRAEENSAPKIMTPSAKLIEKLTDRILYEDSDLLILNKPVGLAVHGGTDISMGVIEVLRQMRQGKNDFLELAHRLDRDTSGCLVIAKKRSVLRELHELLRAGKIEKIYRALTMGRWPKKDNRISAQLERQEKSQGGRKIKVSEEGKASVTDFHVQQVFGLASLMSVKLHTGRMHQIRVHAQSAGHPVAGDTKYGDKAFNRMMHQLGLRRLFLHAEKIRFQLPSTLKTISVEAPLDEELSVFLSRLK